MTDFRSFEQKLADYRKARDESRKALRAKAIEQLKAMTPTEIRELAFEAMTPTEIRELAISALKTMTPTEIQELAINELITRNRYE